MSLVEKALRKMQSGPAAVAERTAAPRRAPEAAPELGRSTPAVPLPSLGSTPIADHRTDKVVTINQAALRSCGLLPYPEQERRLAAEYRQIKRPLMAAARGKGSVGPNSRLIMVASALPGEGKTFTSINLALSMALEKDTSVLLVDGDIAKSHVSRTLDIQDEPGLMDLLLNESHGDIGSVILPTSVRGLSILPAGRESATATEFLASSRMESIVNELLSRDPRRIVLFDSPPLLLTTESRALTAIAGQIVLVVRAEETTHKAVLDALACIGEGKSVGLVLNQCQASATQFYYGYGEYARASDPDSDRQ